MKKMLINLYAIIFLSISFTCSLLSQEQASFDLSYDIHKVYPSLSISKGALTQAKTISDLNVYYKPEWVKEYVSVEITASHRGQIQSILSNNDVISKAQKALMTSNDEGTEITVDVKYIPENDLVNNEIKSTDFSFYVEPENDAIYREGQAQLKQYLKENTIDKLSKSFFKKHHLTAVKFTIDKEGRVVNPYVFESSKNDEVDAILLETVCNMPTWKPANYNTGLQVPQEFVFTVGDMHSCVTNLLNIKNNPLLD